MSAAAILAGLTPIAMQALADVIKETSRAKSTAEQIRMAKAALAAVALERASIETARRIIAQKRKLNR